MPITCSALSVSQTVCGHMPGCKWIDTEHRCIDAPANGSQVAAGTYSNATTNQTPTSQNTDCGRFYGEPEMCNMQAGCSADGPACLANAVVIPASGSAPAAAPVAAPAAAPAATPGADMSKRFTHVCVPKSAQAPTIFACGDNDCNYGCHSLNQDACTTGVAAEMCQWTSTNTCVQRPSAYNVISADEDPLKYVETLVNRAGNLANNAFSQCHAK